MSSAGSQPFSDVSGRMAVFGRMFGEQIGIPDPATLPTTESLVAVIRSHVPRGMENVDDEPVFEAAAYLGEWMRRKSNAAWVAEGPFEPHLQLVDPSRAIVYLLPLVQIVRTASTAGYDGLAERLDLVLADVAKRAKRGPLSALRIDPPEDRDSVVAWTKANAEVKNATRAALWRRCSVCSNVEESSLTIHRPSDDWEAEAALAAANLAGVPFECACGGPAGAATRFLMLRHHDGKKRLGDIYVANTHTRVGCWTLLPHDEVEPFDALCLTSDEVVS